MFEPYKKHAADRNVSITYYGEYRIRFISRHSLLIYENAACRTLLLTFKITVLHPGHMVLQAGNQAIR
ncbi:hypothetical protein KUTeg_005452 [Tegillarca granosa]|uniref:Uncharacterized protein n=1 Tax=Tegillarca granosa TaxID=220873 RepID=A0ABQ9FPB4_TEGGR|nr:hypothetical protein KUTeg_005452 [Tegillarca granosa]